MHEGSDPKVYTDAKKGHCQGDPCSPRKCWKRGTVGGVVYMVVYHLHGKPIRFELKREEPGTGEKK
jgi:hypothetical protein